MRWGEIASDKGALSGKKAEEDEETEESEDERDQPQDSPMQSHQSQARTVALTDISFTIKPGQLAALVGPSGARG